MGEKEVGTLVLVRSLDHNIYLAQFNLKGVEYFPCTLRIRGAYLLMVPLGRAFIGDRAIISFSRNSRKC